MKGATEMRIEEEGVMRSCVFLCSLLGRGELCSQHGRSFHHNGDSRYYWKLANTIHAPHTTRVISEAREVKGRKCGVKCG